MFVRSEFASAKIRQRHTDIHSITFISHRYIVQNKCSPHLCSFYDIIIKDASNQNQI